MIFFIPGDKFAAPLRTNILRQIVVGISRDRDLQSAQVDRKHEADLPSSQPQQNATSVCELRVLRAAGYRKAGADGRIGARDVARVLQVVGLTNKVRAG